MKTTDYREEKNLATGREDYAQKLENARKIREDRRKANRIAAEKARAISALEMDFFDMAARAIARIKEIRGF